MPPRLLHDLASPLGWSLIEGDETHAAFAAWALDIGPSLSRRAALKLSPSSRTLLFVPNGVTDVLRKDPRWSLGVGRRVPEPMLAFAQLCESLSICHRTDLFAVVEDRLGVGAEHGTRMLRVGGESYCLWLSEEGSRSLHAALREYSSQPSFGIHLGVSYQTGTFEASEGLRLDAVSNAVFASALLAYDGEAFVISEYHRPIERPAMSP